MSKGIEAFNKFCDSVNACVNSGGITNVDPKAKEQVEKELNRLNDLDMECNRLLAENQYLEIEKQEKEKALKIIVKKANIRLREKNGRYYFKTTNNLYEISKEKYDLLKEVLL